MPLVYTHAKKSPHKKLDPYAASILHLAIETRQRFIFIGNLSNLFKSRVADPGHFRPEPDPCFSNANVTQILILDLGD